MAKRPRPPPSQNGAGVSDVIDHVGVRVSDLQTSRPMYEQALAELGFIVLGEGEFEGDGYVLFGRGESDDFALHTRGPYTASVYADGATCLQGSGVEISGGGGGNATADTPAGTIQLNGAGESDSDGHALTMVDGRIGDGVTGVTITRSDGSSVQATVKNGWYLAWWPGSEHAVTARVASANGTSTQSFPSGPQQPAPACPTGSHCSSGYGFATGSAHRAGQSSVRITGGSASSH